MNLVRAKFTNCTMHGLDVKGLLSAESMFLCKNINTKTESIPRGVTRKDLHAK